MSTIMIVDDDANMRLLVEMALRRNGDYRILSCASGEAALQMIKEEKPNLVLLDIMMPGMNGFDVCKAIKSSEETKFISVIIISSLRDVNDKLKGMETGADDYIVKPFNPDELFGRIKARLRIQELETELVKSKQLETALSMLVTLQHEINNPLAGIMGNAESLQEWRTLPPSEVDNSISAVFEQSKRIRDVVQKLSSIRKVVESTYIGDTKMIDINRSTSDVIVGGKKNV
jgi:DNA-binding response OmpR family regulator